MIILAILNSSSVFTVKNPLLIANMIGKVLWTVGYFTFTATSIRENSTTNNVATGLYIIGNVSHPDFTTIQTQWFFSTQHLVWGSETEKAFSSTVTSPASTAIPEPDILAMFALVLKKEPNLWLGAFYF